MEVLAVVFAVCLVQLPTSSYTEDTIDAPTLSELSTMLQDTTLDAESLFAQTSSRAAKDLHRFLSNVPRIGRDTVTKIEPRAMQFAHCRSVFEEQVKKIRHRAHLLAEYNAENHQKYFLAHMIVFRMHLNRSSDLIKRSEVALRTCPSPCRSTETRRNLFRWHHSATEEIHRVKDDLQHSRLALRDLLNHSHRRLNRIHRRAERDVQIAVSELYQCSKK